MNEEEQEVMERFKVGITILKTTGITNKAMFKINDCETLLNLIQKQSKVIDEMARIFYKISKGEYVTIEKNIEIEEIKQYFYRKVEEDVKN